MPSFSKVFLLQWLEKESESIPCQLPCSKGPQIFEDFPLYHRQEVVAKALFTSPERSSGLFHLILYKCQVCTSSLLRCGMQADKNRIRSCEEEEKLLSDR